MLTQNCSNNTAIQQIAAARRSLALARYALERGQEAIGAEALAWSLYQMPAAMRQAVLAEFGRGPLGPH